MSESDIETGSLEPYAPPSLQPTICSLMPVPSPSSPSSPRTKPRRTSYPSFKRIPLTSSPSKSPSPRVDQQPMQQPAVSNSPSLELVSDAPYTVWPVYPPTSAPTLELELVCVIFSIPTSFELSSWSGTAASTAMRNAIALILKVNASYVSFGYSDQLCSVTSTAYPSLSPSTYGTSSNSPSLSLTPTSTMSPSIFHSPSPSRSPSSSRAPTISRSPSSHSRPPITLREREIAGDTDTVRYDHTVHQDRNLDRDYGDRDIKMKRFESVYDRGIHSPRSRDSIAEWENLAFSVRTLLPVNSSEAAVANLTATVQDVVLEAASTGVLCQEFKSQGKALNVTLTWNSTMQSQACPDPFSVTPKLITSFPTSTPTSPPPRSLPQSLLTARSIGLLSILILIALIRFNADIVSSVFFNKHRDAPCHLYTVAVYNDCNGKNNDNDVDRVIFENIRHDDILFFRYKEVEKGGKEVEKYKQYGEWKMNTDVFALELKSEVQFYIRGNNDNNYNYNNYNINKNDNYYNNDIYNNKNNMSNLQNNANNTNTNIIKDKETRCDERKDKRRKDEEMNDLDFMINDLRTGVIINVKPYNSDNEKEIEDDLYDKMKMEIDEEDENERAIEKEKSKNSGDRNGGKRVLDLTFQHTVRTKASVQHAGTRVWRRSSDLTQTHTHNLSESSSFYSLTRSPIHTSFSPPMLSSPSSPPTSHTPTLLFTPPHVPIHVPMPSSEKEDQRMKKKCVWSNTYVYNDPEYHRTTPVELHRNNVLNLNGGNKVTDYSDYGENIGEGDESSEFDSTGSGSGSSSERYIVHIHQPAATSSPISVSLASVSASVSASAIQSTNHINNFDNTMIPCGNTDIGRDIGNRRDKSSRESSEGFPISPIKNRLSRNYIPFSRYPPSDVSSDISGEMVEYDDDFDDDDDDDDDEWECRQVKTDYDEDEDDDDDDDEWNARVWEEKVEWNNNNTVNGVTRPSMTVVSDLSESIFSSESESDSSYSVTHSYAGSGSVNDFDRDRDRDRAGKRDDLKSSKHVEEKKKGKPGMICTVYFFCYILPSFFSPHLF